MLPNSEDDLYDASHGVLSSEFDRVEGVTDGVHCADRYEFILGRPLRITLWHVAIENRCRYLTDVSSLDQLALVSYAPCVVLLVLDALQFFFVCEGHAHNHK